MSGRKLLRRFSSSISDLLSLQKKEFTEEDEQTLPLHNAVQLGNLQMVCSFVESKTCWIDEEDLKGRTALHYSMEQCNSEIASILLKNGANADCVDFEGFTASHVACREGMIDHFNLLLYYHADLCAIDKCGRTPFDLACEYGQEKMMERVLNCGIRRNCLINAGETHVASALHLAALNGHVQIVSKLLENGWDINRTTWQGSALHIAASSGKTQVVRFLLRAGISTDLVSGTGLNALEWTKKNSAKNPITYKEIRFLLKNCKTFKHATAINEHCGVKADELSFSERDRIWVIERNETSSWKGIVFGQKGNSRSGFFQAKSVVINDKTEVTSMSSKLLATPMNGRHCNMAKPVPTPSVPSYHNRADLNQSLSMSSFGRTNSSMSNYSNESSNNGNRRNDAMSQSTFSTYGVDTASMLGVNRKKSQMFPSTSGLSPCSAGDAHRISTGSNSSYGSSGFESMKCSTSMSSSSFLPNSLIINDTSDATPSHSSLNSTGSGESGGSSIASSSVQTLHDSFHSASTAAQTPTLINVTQLVQNGVPPAEVLANWLDSINMTDYLSLFLKQGYDLYSIARCTPEDLLSLGIKNPEHRKKLIAEIHEWHFTDNWPSTIPIGGMRDWLYAIALGEYVQIFENQGYCTVNEILNLTWEDFEDIGIKRLGHLKRLGLAIKKIKDNRRNLTNQTHQQQQKQVYHPRAYDPPPPAPGGGNFYQKMDQNDKIDYISYTRATNMQKPQPPARKDIRNSYDALFSEDEPIRLNLVSTGKILSDISRMKDHESIGYESSGSNSECPPPPAPLFCDSRRFLRTSMGSSNGSMSSNEQLPFANENCGTIRSATVKKSFDFPTSLPPLIAVDNSSNSNKKPDTTSTYQEIDEMMKNLVGELDTMMMSSTKSSTTNLKK